MGKKHDETAKKIASQKGASYNRGQGPDVQTPQQVIEVETADTIGDAGRQLAGFRRAAYVAGADKNAAEKALEHYKGTTIGVMDDKGKVLKRSTRKRGGS